jgi:hypothetical protein
MKGLLSSNASEATGSHLAEIDEELLFHLRSRVEDNKAAGMNEDEAWDDARRRLGSYRSSVEECHEIRTAGWKRLGAAIAAAALLLFALGWITTDWRTKALAAQQTVITEQLGVLTTAVSQTAVAGTTLAASESEDLVTLVTRSGKPVQNANVLLILKTWPNDRYRQEPFHAKTDSEGKATFEQLIPEKGQFAVHVAVFHEGSALTSAYHLFKATGKRNLKDIKPLKVSLAAGQKMKFRLKDEQGNVLANAHVVPFSRQAGKAEPHLVYMDAAGPVTVSSNTDGEVNFSYFARGDDVKLVVTPVGRPATEAECTIPTTGDVVDVTVKPTR